MIFKKSLDIAAFLCYNNRAACLRVKDFISRKQRVFNEKAGARKMYAVIETGGKQYQVKEGDVIYVEKLESEVDSEITFDKVVAVNDDKALNIGAPYVDGASVAAKVLKNGKAKKIIVSTYKPKKNEKRKLGHRQPYTKVEITKINA